MVPLLSSLFLPHFFFVSPLLRRKQREEKKREQKTMQRVREHKYVMGKGEGRYERQMGGDIKWKVGA